jgi:hypothetical protein
MILEEPLSVILENYLRQVGGPRWKEGSGIQYLGRMRWTGRAFRVALYIATLLGGGAVLWQIIKAILR